MSHNYAAWQSHYFLIALWITKQPPPSPHVCIQWYAYGKLMIPITISNQTHVLNGSFMHCCLIIMSSTLCKLLCGTPSVWTGKGRWGDREVIAFLWSWVCTVSAAAPHYMRVNQDKRDNIIMNKMLTSLSKLNRTAMLHLLTKCTVEWRQHVQPN